MKIAKSLGSAKARIIAFLGWFAGLQFLRKHRLAPAAPNLRYYLPLSERRDLTKRLQCKGRRHHRAHRRQNLHAQKRSRRVNWGLIPGNHRAKAQNGRI